MAVTASLRDQTPSHLLERLVPVEVIDAYNRPPASDVHEGPGAAVSFRCRRHRASRLLPPAALAMVEAVTRQLFLVVAVRKIICVLPRRGQGSGSRPRPVLPGR